MLTLTVFIMFWHTIVCGVFQLEILLKILRFLISLKSLCACLYMPKHNIQDIINHHVYQNIQYISYQEENYGIQYLVLTWM